MLKDTPADLIDSAARHTDNEITNMLEHFGYLKKYMGQLEEAQKELRAVLTGPGLLDHDSKGLRAVTDKVYDILDRAKPHRREFEMRARFATNDCDRTVSYLTMYDATLDTLEGSK